MRIERLGAWRPIDDGKPGGALSDPHTRSKTGSSETSSFCGIKILEMASVFELDSGRKGHKPRIVFPLFP